MPPRWSDVPRILNFATTGRKTRDRNTPFVGGGQGQNALGEAVFRYHHHAVCETILRASTLRYVLHASRL